MFQRVQHHFKSASTTHSGGHKKPRTTSIELHASVGLDKVRVHDSIIRKRLGKIEQTTADPKEHRTSSHVYQKTSWMIHDTFGKIF